MEKKIEHATGILKKTILKSSTYQTYLQCTNVLKKRPDLMRQVQEMRKATIESYHNPDNQDLTDSSDQILARFGDLRKSPEVIAYLDAEDELIRTLQQIYKDVLAGMKINLPES